MIKRPITWFVLADGSRARFVIRRPKDLGCEISEEYEPFEAHIPTYEIASDRPDRVHENANAARHKVEPRQGAHRARKDAFVRQLASRLNAAPAAEGTNVEIVERKGIGHPDTICDGLAEAASLALCRLYLACTGMSLHHNVDKVLLRGGQARPSFGGGVVTEPIEIFLATVGRCERLPMLA